MFTQNTKRNTLSFEVMCCNIGRRKDRKARRLRKTVHKLVCGAFKFRLDRPLDLLHFAGKLSENNP